MSLWEPQDDYMVSADDYQYPENMWNAPNPVWENDAEPFQLPGDERDVQDNPYSYPPRDYSLYGDEMTGNDTSVATSLPQPPRSSSSTVMAPTEPWYNSHGQDSASNTAPWLYGQPYPNNDEASPLLHRAPSFSSSSDGESKASNVDHRRSKELRPGGASVTAERGSNHTGSATTHRRIARRREGASRTSAPRSSKKTRKSNAQAETNVGADRSSAWTTPTSTRRGRVGADDIDHIDPAELHSLAKTYQEYAMLHKDQLLKMAKDRGIGQALQMLISNGHRTRDKLGSEEWDRKVLATVLVLKNVNENLSEEDFTKINGVTSHFMPFPKRSLASLQQLVAKEAWRKEVPSLPLRHILNVKRRLAIPKLREEIAKLGLEEVFNDKFKSAVSTGKGSKKEIEYLIRAQIAATMENRPDTTAEELRSNQAIGSVSSTGRGVGKDWAKFVDSEDGTSRRKRK